MWVSALVASTLAFAGHGSVLARPSKARKQPQPTAADARPEPAPEAAVPEPAAPEIEPATDSPPPAAEHPAAGPSTSAAPAEPSPKKDAEPLVALSTELAGLMDELVQARARAALLGKTLFKTLLRVHVQNLAEDSASLAKLVLKLDGAPIYRGDAGSLRGDEQHQVFEGFVAPGPHVLTAEIDQNSRDDSAYGYALRESYRFQALRDKRNELSLVLADDSDVASEFPDDQDGEYDIRTRLRVRTEELSER